MTKQELTSQSFKYITTQCNDEKIELWSKFSGNNDTIQYYFYSPKLDATIGVMQTISYMQLDMFAQMMSKMREDFCKYYIKYEKENKWMYNNPAYTMTK
jgi:hypothetical protein